MLRDRAELDAGLVGGERQVDHDRDVRLVEERARAGAGERGLLLGDRQREHVAGRAAGLGHEPSGLSGDVAADSIVERTGHDPVVAEVERRRIDHGDVADPDELAGLVAVLRPDVDV